MFLNILLFLYFCAFIAAGQAVASACFWQERTLTRLLMGGVFALLMLLWLPALTSFVLGFTVLSQCVALAVCIAGGVFAMHVSRGRELLRTGLAQEKGALLALAPLFAMGVYLFLTHVLNPQNGALHSGQSTFGDLPLHLGLTASIAAQGMFPPQYSILPGVAVGYPFLCDSISATFVLLGASLRFAMLLPSFLAYALVLVGAYCFFVQWLKSKGTAIFATLLFFMGGGFGFWYFVDLIKENPNAFSRIFTEFYHTPTNYTYGGLRWVNTIADMLIPQRATLFGWALLFPSLYLLRRAAFEDEPHLFVYLGIIAGCLPLVHTHSFLALGIISAMYLLCALMQGKRDMLIGFLKYGLIVALLAAPQLLLFTFRQSGDFIKSHFNWGNETDSFLWFYIKNLGLIFLLLPIAYFRLPRKEKSFYNGALMIWLLAEYIQFQPNPYDNNKLLFIWFAFTCGMVAKLLAELYEALRQFPGRRYLAACAIVVLFLSGTLSLGRECVSDYEQFSADEAQAAAFIQKNTLPDSLFLTSTNHNNAVSSLTGRNIYCGTGSYLFFHGVDYQAREQQVRMLFEQPDQCFEALRQQYGIDYVFDSNYERYSYDIDYFFYEQFPIVFENETVRIFDVSNQ